ncbi:Uncharacterised protein [Mycobacteroides abscessus subsp. abscessus]|nr:Uncharacterised protein [Mycobacteroides abscessus subsp. abscessus]
MISTRSDTKANDRTCATMLCKPWTSCRVNLVVVRTDSETSARINRLGLSSTLATVIGRNGTPSNRRFARIVRAASTVPLAATFRRDRGAPCRLRMSRRTDSSRLARSCSPIASRTLALISRSSSSWSVAISCSR